MIYSYPLGVAIVGLGAMGQRHIKVLQKMPHLAKLCAVFDINKKKVAQIEKDILLKTGAKIGVKSYGELLDRRPDAVIIATPVETHAVLTIEALGKGISVLVEKPMASNVQDAKIMVDVARDRAILMVGYTERFNGATQILREEIKDESVIAITTRRAGPNPTPRVQSSIIDAAVTHDIDLIHYLTGADFESITAETDETNFFSATFKLTNGIAGNIEADKLSPIKERFITVWSKGKFWRADLTTQTVQSFRHYRKFGVYTTQVSSQPHTEPLREELKAFLSAVSTGGLSPISGEDGLRVLQVVERCQ